MLQLKREEIKDKLVLELQYNKLSERLQSTNLIKKALNYHSLMNSEDI